ncbi:MAG: N(4)-(beta-N-acetylglucosaminyl)-L-asparaginase [Saprospiraceae bacterium]
MLKRRKFFSQTALGISGFLLGKYLPGNFSKAKPEKPLSAKKNAPLKAPFVLSTWDAGIEANEGAWKVLKEGGSALDAVEKGVMVTEADIRNQTVGIGGLPDRDGHVTLDACIMDHKGNAGSACFVENFVHPVSIARRIMEKTPHVILAGDGAEKFAEQEGFKKVNLLSEKSKEDWKEWLHTSEYKPVINIENHDTIGMLSMDQKGDLSGACTTSGLAYKVHGRVGDSPIIGAGLYVDNEVGAAVATGLGEVVLKSLSSFLIVELMRNGAHPEDACKEALERIVQKFPNYKDFQVAFIGVDKAGNYGGYSIHPGFNIAIHTEGENKLYSSPHLLD